MIKQYISMESEEICGYFVTTQQKKIWNIELNILIEFMRVCNKNKLKFFVAQGHCLVQLGIKDLYHGMMI